MLLPFIRKIIHLKILNRVSKAARKRLPKGQSAFQPGRAASEQVLAVKMLHEKALVTSDVPVQTKLIDMSKTCDIVCGNLVKQKCKCIMDKSFHSLRALTGPP